MKRIGVVGAGVVQHGVTHKWTDRDRQANQQSDRETAGQTCRYLQRVDNLLCAVKCVGVVGAGVVQHGVPV